MKSNALFLTITSLAFFLFSCSEQSSNTTQPKVNKTSATQQATQTTAPSSLNVSNLQNYLKDSKPEKLEQMHTRLAKSPKADWTKSPFQIALQFGNDQLESRSKKVEVQTISPENHEEVIATIIEDGFEDDSVKGSLTILSMKKQNGRWQIIKAVQLWECWEDRTERQEKYSQQPCS